jgi:hypothetical protein
MCPIEKVATKVAPTNSLISRHSTIVGATLVATFLVSRVFQQSRKRESSIEIRLISVASGLAWRFGVG